MKFDLLSNKKLIGSMYGKMRANSRIAHLALGGDAWTLAAMVGHLVDSASNNHQRFLRLQAEPVLVFPAYQAESWKEASAADGFDYRKLIALWKNYNEYLLHIIENIDESKLDNYWDIDGKKLSLGFLVTDYFEHLRWHDALFDVRVGEIRALKKKRTGKKIP